MTKLAQDLAWRIPMYREYLFYALACKNYKDIIGYRRDGGTLNRLELRNGVVLEMVGNPRFCLDIFREVWQQKVYLKPHQLTSPRTVVDIGSHLGFFAVQAALQWPQAQIVAYEPDVTNFNALNRNIDRNRISNVKTYNCAVWKEVGQVAFNVKAQVESHSVFDTDIGGATKEHITVAATTLGEIVRQLGHQEIDLLKIDCEGCEFELVASSLNVFSSHVKHLVMEYHSNIRNDIQAALVEPLQALGFEVKVIPHQGRLTGMIEAKNCRGQGDVVRI
jgi:FkbM family methyltransferase